MHTNLRYVIYSISWKLRRKDFFFSVSSFSAHPTLIWIPIFRRNFFYFWTWKNANFELFSIKLFWVYHNWTTYLHCMMQTNTWCSFLTGMYKYWWIFPHILISSLLNILIFNTSIRSNDTGNDEKQICIQVQKTIILRIIVLTLLPNLYLIDLNILWYWNFLFVG